MNSTGRCSAATRISNDASSSLPYCIFCAPRWWCKISDVPSFYVHSPHPPISILFFQDGALAPFTIPPEITGWGPDLLKLLASSVGLPEDSKIKVVIRYGDDGSEEELKGEKKDWRGADRSPFSCRHMRPRQSFFRCVAHQSRCPVPVVTARTVGC